jgi:diguanylate cyclase (GGDEF)-like protein
MKIIVTGETAQQASQLATLVSQLGHTPLIAVDETDVLEKCRFDNLDLILLDVKLNGSDGFQCAQHLHHLRLERWMPIIFIGDFHDEKSIANVIGFGDDYLVKPVTQARLAGKLHLFAHVDTLQNQLSDITKNFYALSRLDTLTGLNNRVQFDTLLREKIVLHGHRNDLFAVLAIGLDHFRIINDNLGYHIGDLLLKSVAKRLRTCLRIDDVVARTGGDEFNIILDNMENTQVAEATAAKIMQALAAPHQLASTEVQINCSIGITIFPTDGTTTEVLTQNANLALVHAKASGRNNYQYFIQKLADKRKEQAGIENALKFAIDREELMLTYQPIYNLSQQQMVGMEALIAWRHPKLGVISPTVFIPLAEENGLIETIGNWIIHKAFAQAAKWHLAGFQNFKLAVNISPRNLLQANLAEILTDVIHKTQVPPQIIELELTETAAMTYSTLTYSTIQRIHELGFRIALDDFGTGYSSLFLLNNLPISTIKIDKSFIDHITTHHHDVMLVKSMITLANNLGLNIIAEGIESAEQLQLLIANGCPQGQGYFLSKALSAERITAIMRAASQKKSP